VLRHASASARKSPSAEMELNTNCQLLFAFRHIHHNVMFGVTFQQWIHRGQADELIFAGTELKRRILHLVRDPGELALAFLIRIDAHVEFVEAAETISDVHIDQRREQGLAVRGGDVELC
jgi:hypothetical protein